MFGKRFKLIRLLGLDFQPDLSCLIALLLLVWTLATLQVHFDFSGVPEWAYWPLGFTAAVACLVSIVLHEFAHAIVARQAGTPMSGVTLFAFGGVADIGSDAANPKSEILISCAGPITSLILGGVLAGVAAFGHAAGWPLAIIGLLAVTAAMNGLLCGFNLLPAFPLDGGRVLRAILWKWRGDLIKATQVVSLMGSGFGMAMFAVSLVFFVSGDLLAGLWCLLLGLSLRQAAWMAYHQFLGEQFFAGRVVEEFMRDSAFAVPDSVSVREGVDDYIDRHHCNNVPVIHEDRLVGTFHLHQAMRVPNDDWGQYTVRQLSKPIPRTEQIAPDRGVVEVLAMMLGMSARCLPVVQGEHLVGVIVRQDLLELLHLNDSRAVMRLSRGW